MKLIWSIAPYTGRGVPIRFWRKASASRSNAPVGGYHRSEHWVVVSGSAKIFNGEQESFLATNESTYIPCGHKHRLENPGRIDLVIIEVQSGYYLGEDNIVRFRRRLWSDVGFTCA